ncbi:MAG: type II secretion system inner membrane protein GspF [Gammaproteobacteria bacterium]|nr:type II secretion system inner membrane protein GspF [Gammaproteobacteria bacterium]NNF48929.1 type II secretion system inner membrane protein GspF [Woeseiaceae bacterium]MBT8094975.1 type II secretion system inner membrane protein GspF [Gammaproteobacteria bacterium]MBT8104645.1 type II secretion system inner membrane protein GspF [Gammaproteobacteria bacterium]NNK24659.1 type II secretion system inner membrane protein GspF [Woeseiaceae bacterium]
MGAFEYTALDQSGKQSKGLLEGDTPKHVRQILRDRNLFPVSVNEVAKQEARRQRGFTLRRGMSPGELALITRQLASLSQSGLPLEEALLAVAQQNDLPRTKSILLGVRAKVMEGHSLADGFREFPQAFPELYRATVAAGEQSGHLDVVLERLADYTEARQELRQRVSGALIYPIALVIFSVLIVGFMLMTVVPKIVTVFESTRAELPGLTKLMIGTSEFLQSFWLPLIIGVFAVGWAIRWVLQREGPRRRYHRLLLRLPIIARLTRGVNTARFTRTLSILAGSGVPILEALKISAEVIENVPMRDAVLEASLRVREGASIAKSLAASKLFPPMMIHLVSSGEAGGRLEDMLARAAAGQEREVDGLIAALLGILQPLLIILMGGIVLTIVLAILLPIFEMNNLIQ